MHKLPIIDQWTVAWMPDVPLAQAAPHAAENQPVSLPHIFGKRALALYRRHVSVDAPCAYVEFDAVDQCCRVFIDGEEVGGHQGGYSRFRVKVPEKALKNGGFDLALLVDNRLNEHVSPHFGDFTIFGGIPRPVRLLTCGETHFDYGYYGTEGVIVRSSVDENGDGVLSIEPRAVNAKAASLFVEVSGQEGVIARGEGKADETLRLALPHPSLWNGRQAPALYTVRAELRANGQTADAVEIQTGFRTARATAQGFLLNGAPCSLRGVARHQDRAEVFTAASPEQIAEDFDLIDEIGANAVRLSHYQHPQAAYDECDRRGILCWAEIPMLKMTEDAALQENAQTQLTELILQNIHHPSVFCWGIQNEIAMFRDAPFMHEACQRLCDLAHSLDPDRQTACANLFPVPPESRLNGITDLVGYNYYFGWYYGEFSDYGKYLDAFHAARPDTPIGITEYGADANLALHSAEPRVKDYSEEYQALYHESVYPYLRERPWLWGSFIWNMFNFSSERRNEGGTKGLNAKGLVTYDRKIKKDAFYYYKAQWSETPFLHLCGRRYAKRTGEKTSVKIYTNCPKAVLTVNGERFAEAKNDGNGVIVFENVPLRGQTALRASCGECSDEITIFQTAQEESSYRLPEGSQGGRVVNWFLQEKQKDDCFSILSTAQEILENPKASAVLQEMKPAIYQLLTGDMSIPLGLTLNTFLGRDAKDPEEILRINHALQEIPKSGIQDRRD